MMPPKPTRVLFVCMGNICRSPLAEGVFLSLVRARGLEGHYHVDSAGTGGWHAGEGPDVRSVEVAHKNGVTLEGYARQVKSDDFEDFDWVIAMDRQNLRDLRPFAPPPRDRATHIHLLREFDTSPGDQEVPDPYYGGPDGFDDVFGMVQRSCAALLDHLETLRIRAEAEP